MEKNNVKIEKFLKSVIYGRLLEVKLAIDEGIDVDAFGRNSKTALMYAASHFRIPIVKYFIEAGADINTKVKAFSTEDSLEYTDLTVLEYCYYDYDRFTKIIEFLERVETNS